MAKNTGVECRVDILGVDIGMRIRYSFMLKINVNQDGSIRRDYDGKRKNIISIRKKRIIAFIIKNQCSSSRFPAGQNSLAQNIVFITLFLFYFR